MSYEKTQTAPSHFKPVDIAWQMKKSVMLHLPVDAISNEPCNSMPSTIKNKENCSRWKYFRVISYVLTGSEIYHKDVQQSIVNHMYKLGERMASILPEHMTVDKYVKTSKMRQKCYLENTCWNLCDSKFTFRCVCMQWYAPERGISTDKVLWYGAKW